MPSHDERFQALLDAGMLTTEPVPDVRCQCGHLARDHRAMGDSFCPACTAAGHDPHHECFTNGNWQFQEAPYSVDA